MKIVGFMCITNPLSGNYPYLEAIRSHLIFLDKLVIIDGGSNDGTLEELDEIRREYGDRVEVKYLEWKQGRGNWTWEEFSNHWNYGLELCKQEEADWVCAGECDHVWHERDAGLVRERLEEHGGGRAVGWVDKLVSSVWWKWNSKSKFAYFLNVKEFPMLGYGLDRNWKGGQDLANPILVLKEKGEWGVPEGVMISHEAGKNLGIYFWNYDKTFQTKENIIKSRESANWAWNNGCLVKLGIMESWEETDVLTDVLNRMKSRFSNALIVQRDVNLHPSVMKKRLESMDENMLGYSLFNKI